MHPNEGILPSVAKDIRDIMLRCVDITKCLRISHLTVAHEIVLYDTLGWLQKVSWITLCSMVSCSQAQPGSWMRNNLETSRTNAELLEKKKEKKNKNKFICPPGLNDSHQWITRPPQELVIINNNKSYFFRSFSIFNTSWLCSHFHSFSIWHTGHLMTKVS